MVLPCEVGHPDLQGALEDKFSHILDTIWFRWIRIQQTLWLGTLEICRVNGSTLAQLPRHRYRNILCTGYLPVAHGDCMRASTLIR